MTTRPTVVVVGRPNVGKSTLFNRLTRSRRALVHDLAGVTRDRIVGEAERPRGGTVTLVDTGGLLLADEDHFIPLVRRQAERAIVAADVVVFLLDGAAGPLPEDVEIAGYLRSLEVVVVPVVNKGDRAGVELAAHEFHRLGLGPAVVVSAEHGTGMGDLWDAVEAHLPPADATAAADLEAADADDDPDRDTDPDGSDAEVSVAIIGRPNVGKSSLLNRLAGEPRVLVSEIPGTTRDAVDVLVERDGRRLRFVDTAGIRRKGRTERGPEVLSVVLARRHLERADLCLLVVDAVEGVTRQDAHVAGYAWEAGRAVAVVVNKWDLVTDRERARKALDDALERDLKFIRHAPRVYLSALTGRGVHRVFPVLETLAAAHRRRISTARLNQLLRQVWDHHPPPALGRRPPRLKYASQVGTRPPKFALLTNLAEVPHFSYVRHVENELREALDLEGVPIRVMIRTRKS